MTQRDLVLRWLEQLGALIRRLIQGGGPADLELALERVREALAQQLGTLAPVAARLDPPSVAALLHDADRIYGYARLLGFEAAVLQAQGRETEWQVARDRAMALARLALLRAGDETPEEWRQWVAEMGGKPEG